MAATADRQVDDPAGGRAGAPTAAPGAAATPLVYPFGTGPAPGAAHELAPGVRWIRLPLLGELQHINVWAIADGGGWAIVDCGLFTAEVVAVWETLLETGLEGRPVTRIVVTHQHPDHVGMAGWLARRFGCALWMTPPEYAACADTQRGERLDAGVAFYRAAGWPRDALERYRTQANDLQRYVDALPPDFTALHDGDRLTLGGRLWEIVTGSGHSPEHACLWCAELGLFISGDQVLPTISSNVSVTPASPRADPLGRWLASLDKLARRIPDHALVLPAHGLPFRGLHQRLAQLAAGHAGGLQRLRDALSRPARVVDLHGALFRRVPGGSPFHLRLASGECVAHLNRLIAQGEVEVSRDADGVDWYRLVRAGAAHDDGLFRLVRGGARRTRRRTGKHTSTLAKATRAAHKNKRRRGRRFGGAPRP
ncbi:MBL fold metallo-hydrolase, partial [Paraburkholderia phytofirmans]|uniref:MBL fold metallo-hydrolase n=1 Tax=Paraburkholderia phytofirmans TaxID=261302 RepID=UPI0038BC0A7E